MSLILGSNSAIRRHMLGAAGVDFSTARPDCDEAAVKATHGGDGLALAEKLAGLKALSVAAGAQDWVIGSDSVVEVDGRLFDKPASRAEAAEHLAFFAGRTMILSSAVALARDGTIDWHHGERARLTVRPLSAAFIDAYLDAEWPEVGYCVGVFRMEGRGVTLFEAVEGSHFTVLGMPLLPLLGALRARGLVAA